MITFQKKEVLSITTKIDTHSTALSLWFPVFESEVLCHLSVTSAKNLSLSAHGSLRCLLWINVDKPERENGHRMDPPPPTDSVSTSI